MTLGFGPAKERFRHSLFIILVNRLVCCAVAAAALSLAGKSLQPGRAAVPLLHTLVGQRTGVCVAVRSAKVRFIPAASACQVCKDGE